MNHEDDTYNIINILSFTSSLSGSFYAFINISNYFKIKIINLVIIKLCSNFAGYLGKILISIYGYKLRTYKNMLRAVYIPVFIFKIAVFISLVGQLGIYGTYIVTVCNILDRLMYNVRCTVFTLLMKEESSKKASLNYLNMLHKYKSFSFLGSLIGLLVHNIAYAFTPLRYNKLIHIIFCIISIVTTMTGFFYIENKLSGTRQQSYINISETKMNFKVLLVPNICIGLMSIVFFSLGQPQESIIVNHLRKNIHILRPMLLMYNQEVILTALQMIYYLSGFANTNLVSRITSSRNIEIGIFITLLMLISISHYILSMHNLSSLSMVICYIITTILYGCYKGIVSNILISKIDSKMNRYLDTNGAIMSNINLAIAIGTLTKIAIFSSKYIGSINYILNISSVFSGISLICYLIY